MSQMIADHMTPTGQALVLDALAEGKIEGIPAGATRLDTHLNHIFLLGDYAYKIKRAIRLPFVDFSALDQRRAACQAECDINQRFGCPFYIGVEAISERSDGSFIFAGDGVAVEYAVVMRRFDQSQQFDELARAGRLTIAQIEQTAECIVDLHAKAQRVATAGHAADYRHIVRQLHQTEIDGATRLGLAAADSSPFDQLDHELTRLSPLLENRREAGKVRRCHGDLHLRNLCLFEGRPTPFDALEFDDRMATHDVLYDLAFLLMDLQACDMARHANAAMNRYWDYAGEDERALQLLPFFMALRAAVRMAVAVEAGKLDEAQLYRSLSQRLLNPGASRCAVIGGLSGSGKSTVAAKVACRLQGPAGARLLRSDVLRKRKLGLRLEQAAPGAMYAPEQRDALYPDLAASADLALHANASVVVDATFQSAAARASIAKIESSVMRAFWLDAPLGLRIARVANRAGDASDADASVLAKQEEPADLGPEWLRLDAARPPRDIAVDIVGALS